MRKSGGLQHCLRHDLPSSPLAAAYFLHLDRPPKSMFGAHFVRNICHQLLTALTLNHSFNVGMCFKMQMFMQIYLAAYSLKILVHQQKLSL